MPLSGTFTVLTVLCLALLCGGCPSPAPKAAVPAAAPATAPASMPADPPPVIAAQTVAILPAPQPIPPESLPPRPTVEYRPAVAETEPPVSQPSPASARSKGKKPAANTADSPGEAAETHPRSEEKNAAQPLRLAEDKALTKSQIGDLQAEVRALLADIAGGAGGANKTAANRIESLLRLSEQAAAKNDLRQADTLGRRALALARDLNRAK